MKDKKSEYISVRVNKSLKEKIKNKADKEKRSLANMVTIMLEKGVSNA